MLTKLCIWGPFCTHLHIAFKTVKLLFTVIPYYRIPLGISIHINRNSWRILPTNVPNISSNNLAWIYTSERATVSKHWIMTGIDLKKPKGMKYKSDREWGLCTLIISIASWIILNRTFWHPPAWRFGWDEPYYLKVQCVISLPHAAFMSLPKLTSMALIVKHNRKSTIESYA